MALTKQPVPINFSRGLDTKTDEKQVQVGKFLRLRNTVFDKLGRLTKRNGFDDITSLPNAEQTTLTTLADNLLATGSNLYAYSRSTDQWLNQGKIQPVNITATSLLRSSTSQTAADMALSVDGALLCLVYVDSGSAYYQVSDSLTSQQVVARTALPATAVCPRVYTLGRYFIITFIATVGGTAHLQYIAVPMSTPANPGTATDISTDVLSLAAGYDAVVANNSLVFGWAATGTVIKLASLTSTLVVSAPQSIAAHTATLLSMTVDSTATTPVIWISYWDSTSNNGYSAAFNQSLTPILASTQIITTTVIRELTSVAQNSILTVFYENANNYNSTGAYPTATKTDFVTTKTVTQAGAVSAGTVILRSVGLASKPFIDASGTVYLLVTYGEINQPTYFLIDSAGAIYMRLAYANGGGYQSSQVLPTVSYIDGSYFYPYLIKDFLASTNKTTAPPTGTPVNGIYTQTGINLAKFTINSSGQYSSEIASSLHLTGGQMWQYDGVKPVELGFHVWPENVASTTATGSGALIAQTYNYVFCYEWTDNQGRLHRSAPSIPLSQVTTTSTSTNTLYVPTLRLTYKITPNPVRIVGYRWSTAQQTYYQFTSITSPTVNNPAVDYVTIVDAAADSAILGQTLLYTTGGVVENIAPPAMLATALYKNRLFGINAEDRNSLWYSKQIIENTPVEMSDLFTLYVPPTTGSQGSTGPMTAISALDDKLIIFKESAIYYLTGVGPDNTGSQNDFSDATYITAAVGTINPNSIALTPNGIMFKSDKGIWMLDRSLNTSYIGAPVEGYNSNEVLSATVIPGTNQVRFILDNSLTLMYDYYTDQWGDFNNTEAISATLYQGKHTYLNSFGTVFQETPGSYLDGSRPVLMAFTTSWNSLAGIQGFERFYEMTMLGAYYSPFKLNVGLAYDYGQVSQNISVAPDNFTPNWGLEANWGSGGNWGGPGNVFEARVFPMVQKCGTFQVSVDEQYDPSYGVAAGQGLALSGLNLVVGVKKGFKPIKSGRTFG